MGMIKTALSLSFNENDRKFRCCCGLMHVKTGTTIFGCVEIFVFSCLAVQTLISAASTEKSWPMMGLIVTFGFMILYIGIVGMLLLGLRKHNHHLILPHLFLLAFNNFFNIFHLLLFVMFTSGVPMRWYLRQQGIEFPEEMSQTIAGLYLCAITIVVIMVEFWVFSVVYGALSYVKAMNASQPRRPSPAPMHV